MSTQKQYIAELVRHYTAEDSLKEEIKEVKDSIKEAGFDAAILSAVAKAIVQNKVDDLSTKSEDILAAITLARS